MANVTLSKIWDAEQDASSGRVAAAFHHQESTVCCLGLFCILVSGARQDYKGYPDVMCKSDFNKTVADLLIVRGIACGNRGRA